AEVAHKYFKKGDKFLGSGKIHTSSFTKESGEVSYSWQVIINEFEFLNKKESKENEGQVTEFDESEIPF
ncbi:single-stranded DNA-binding protein, partial [Helicobacter sp. WB40]|uniref:single-stranded DNA-binding protein n=1 Tax=Helicobacter sp. WB40 TaxID=3004130 RepID=UPI0022EC0486